MPPKLRKPLFTSEVISHLAISLICTYVYLNKLSLLLPPTPSPPLTSLSSHYVKYFGYYKLFLCLLYVNPQLGVFSPFCPYHGYVSLYNILPLITPHSFFHNCNPIILINKTLNHQFTHTLYLVPLQPSCFTFYQPNLLFIQNITDHSLLDLNGLITIQIFNITPSSHSSLIAKHFEQKT